MVEDEFEGEVSEVIEYEAMASFLGEKDLEEMMFRRTGEFIKF